MFPPPDQYHPSFRSKNPDSLFTSGNALTDFFLQDVGITQFQFNIGQQLLSAGIVLLEVSPDIFTINASRKATANLTDRSRAIFCCTVLGQHSGLGVKSLHGTV